MITTPTDDTRRRSIQRKVSRLLVQVKSLKQDVEWFAEDSADEEVLNFLRNIHAVLATTEEELTSANATAGR